MLFRHLLYQLSYLTTFWAPDKRIASLRLPHISKVLAFGNHFVA